MATTTITIPQRYSDLDLNFTVHPVKKDINKFTGEMAVIHALKNLIMTNHYESPFHPEIGGNVRALLFENMDTITASALQTEITRTIENFEPRVKILNVSVKPDYDNNAFGVTLSFNVINRTEPVTIRFLLERIR